MDTQKALDTAEKIELTPNSHLLTPQQASAYLCGALTYTTVLHYASLKKIPSIKIGNKHYFSPQELDIWRDMGATPEAAKIIINSRKEAAAKKAGATRAEIKLIIQGNKI